MTKPTIHVSDAPSFPNAPKGATKFGSTMAPLGPVLGTKQLGAMYMQVEPGMRAFPLHNHHSNEEMFVILEGTGTYRYGDDEYEVTAGTVCAAPAGGKETAHQLVNTGSSPLKYLSVSTMNDPDVVEYPDSGKFMAIAIGEGRTFMNPLLKSLHKPEDSLSYFDGEDI